MLSLRDDVIVSRKHQQRRLDIRDKVVAGDKLRAWQDSGRKFNTLDANRTNTLDKLPHPGQ